MKFLRFILPFLFERNWHSGSWEVSKPRLILFGTGLLILCCVVLIAALLQSPVIYSPEA